MKMLVIQNRVCEHIEDSLKNVEMHVASRQTNKVDMIVLPEMFSTPYEVSLFEKYAQDDTSIVIRFCRELAMKHYVYVVGGSVPEKYKGSLYNTTYIFNRQGELVKKYRKIHLFSITFPDGSVFKESDVLSPGNELGVFETEFGLMGIMICFDIRYPLLADKLTEHGVKAIIVPGAFNDYTGPKHWETTFRSRAIDNQVFMIGCSPSSDSFGNYSTYGHSLVVDPLGGIMKKLGDKEGIVEVVCDFNDITNVRKRLPILKNRRNLEHLNTELKK